MSRVRNGYKMVWPGLTWIISLVTSSLPHSKMAIGRVRVHKRTHPVKLTVTSIRNAVAPVSRRPMEIPAYVFVYYAREYYLEDSGNPGVPQWVNVSHICSRWRHVALNYPTLWNYLFVASLIRSKGVPLCVCVYSSPLNWEATHRKLRSTKRRS